MHFINECYLILFRSNKHKSAQPRTTIKMIVIVFFVKSIFLEKNINKILEIFFLKSIPKKNNNNINLCSFVLNCAD